MLVLRPGDPAFEPGQAVAGHAYRADEGLDVLDRHHPADEAHHQRGRSRAQGAGRGEGRHVDAVGDAAGGDGVGAVGDLPQAVGFVQRNDGIGGVVAHAAQRLEQTYPELAEIAGLARGTFEHRGVVADPIGRKQVDAPLLGVDAVLRQHQRLVVEPRENRAQIPGVAGGDGVIDAGAWQFAGQRRQRPDGGVHGAHCPEVIDEGRIGAAKLVLGGEVAPRLMRVQKVVQIELVLHGLQAGAQHFGAAGGVLAIANQGVQVFHQFGGRGVAAFFARGGQHRVAEQIVMGEPDHIGRHLVARLAIVFLARAEKHQMKAQVRKSAHDLVHPARHAARDIGVSAFE